MILELVLREFASRGFDVHERKDGRRYLRVEYQLFEFSESLVRFSRPADVEFVIVTPDHQRVPVMLDELAVPDVDPIELILQKLAPYKCKISLPMVSHN
jgi:hypothetical protein